MPINVEVAQRAQEIMDNTGITDSADYEKLAERIQSSEAISDLIMTLVCESGRAGVVLDMKMHKVFSLAKHANKINAAVEAIAMTVAREEFE